MRRRNRTILGPITAMVVAAGCGNGGSDAGTIVTATAAPVGTAPVAIVVASTTPPVEPYLGPLVFSWPRDCSVAVREHVEKDGDAAELSYSLGLEGDGADLIVSFEGLRIDQVNGAPLTEAQHDQIAAAFVLPSFRVAPDGSVVELIGLDAMIDDVVDLVGDESVRAMFETPEMRATIEESVTGKYWDSWVGQWASSSPIDTTLVEGTLQLPITETLTVETQVQFESLPAIADGMATLRSSQVLAGDDFALAMGGVPDLLGIDPSSGELSDALATAEGSRSVIVQATVDPDSIRPISASLAMTVDATIDGVQDSRTETRVWNFDWSASDCVL